MRYIWNDLKNRSNKRKHGISFEAMYEFEWQFAILDRLEWIDGEEREAHIGSIGNALYTVILTERADTLRIISLRRSTNDEILRWREEFHE